MPKFWIWQGFSICELYTVFWIYQNMLWQSSEYILGFKYARIVNMQESRKVPNMRQYGWLCPKRTWIGLNMSEFKITGRVLNIPYFWISHTINSARSLYSIYWKIGIFWTSPRIYGRVLWKNNLSFKIFWQKHSILNLWDSFEYVSGFKYTSVPNILQAVTYSGRLEDQYACLGARTLAPKNNFQVFFFSCISTKKLLK